MSRLIPARIGEMAEYRQSAHAVFDLKYHMIWCAVLGTTYVGTRVFCATVGAVDEATIKAYIESQQWDEDDQGFKITATTEP